MRGADLRARLLGFASIAIASACHDDPRDTKPRVPAPADPTSYAPAPARDDDDGGGPAERPAVRIDGGVLATPLRPYVHFDVNHVLSTGQSNAVANDGVPVLSTTQPFANVMFDVGLMTAAGCDANGCTTYQKPSSFQPLVEGDSFWYPVETMSAGLANEVALLGRDRHHALLVSLHGRSGNSYQCLRKGSCPWWPTKGYLEPFAEALMQIRDARDLAAAAGKTYAVRAVTAIHGEHDHYAYASGDSAFPMPGTDGVSVIADYADALLEWQRDYEGAAQAITGQTLAVPLFLNQYSHWNNVPTTKIAYMQLDAHARAPDKVIVVGPTYALSYSNNCLHFTNHGERQLGAYFAKAYARVVLEGGRWEPLRPTAVHRAGAGAIITVKFLVPAPPLVLDTTRVDDPGNYGFEWSDASESPPAIASVVLTAADEVTIALAFAPTGGGGRLRYAYTFRGCGGPRTLARGNLRDSDATPSHDGYDLFNWAVHFDVPVP